MALREASDSIFAEQYSVSFNVERTARYHAARRGFFESIHRWMLFFIVVLGTAGVSGVITKWSGTIGLDVTVLAALTAILGAANLAFDPAGRARLHESLQRKAFELGATVDGTADPTALECAQWRAKLHRIFAEEPPPRRALDAIVYNATLSARKEHPDDDLLIITLPQRVFKNVLSFENSNFPRRAEVRNRNETSTAA